MAPAVARPISDDANLEHQIEKQMGCMAGFLQLFDRHQILSVKPKRLPSSPAAGSTSPSERSETSGVSFIKEAVPEQCPPSPVSDHDPAGTPARPSLPLPLPVFDFKDGFRSPWKLREAPRLSLDSRAIVDAKGKLRPRDIRTTPAAKNAEDPDPAAAEDQRRSPSVVARLMGLEALPDAGEPLKMAELRRSSSESRVPRDWGVFQPDPAHLAEDMCRSPASNSWEFRKPDRAPRNPMPPLQRKSCFDTRDYFPEPKLSGTLYGEIERRLRMRGIHEPAKDLETLKQILEALQLKGLLHSKPSDHQINGRRNLIYDERILRGNMEPPIVVMKPAASPPAARRPGSESIRLPPRSGSMRRGLVLGPAGPATAKRDRVEIERNRSPRSPDPRSPSSPARRRPAILEPQKGVQPQRRIPAVQSPRASPKRSLQTPRNRQVKAGTTTPKECIYAPLEDDTSTESAISASSQFDFERARIEEYRAGRSLLERCDKLLHSIAAITSSTEQATTVDPQPSPVSVLDSACFLGDESSPSPVLKDSLESEDGFTEWEEGQWNQAVSTVRLELGDVPEMDARDFFYVSQIIRACERHQDSDVYLMLEKERPEAEEPRGLSRLHRRLVCDTVAEIVDRKRNVSSWEAFSRPKAAINGGAPLLRHVWLEVRRLQGAVASDDVEDATCVVIKKDMAGDHVWGDASVELSDAVLHIERLLFKDLIADTIRELADLAGRCRPCLAPRRKLVF